MDKSLKNNKRMSLDPAKNPFSVIHRHHNATELEVRQTSHEESQSSIFNSDHSNKDVLTPSSSWAPSSTPSPRRQTASLATASSVYSRKKDMEIIYMLQLR